MKILFDTNVLIDIIAARPPFMVETANLVSLIGEGIAEGFITANTITDMYYILRKYVSDIKVREDLSKVMKVFQILSITGHDCEEALQASNPDFEDGLLEVCARKSEMNYIVTRDMEFINHCPIAITPSNLLHILK